MSIAEELEVDNSKVIGIGGGDGDDKKFQY